jgi:hypothetical protein
MVKFPMNDGLSKYFYGHSKLDNSVSIYDYKNILSVPWNYSGSELLSQKLECDFPYLKPV